MSWTSEFELPPQGPQVAPEAIDPGVEDGVIEQLVDQTADDGVEDEPTGPGFKLSEIPDEGPLDPSVFDGLFTDLTDANEDADTDENTDSGEDPDTAENTDTGENPDSDTDEDEPAPEPVDYVQPADFDFEADLAEAEDYDNQDGPGNQAADAEELEADDGPEDETYDPVFDELLDEEEIDHENTQQEDPELNGAVIQDTEPVVEDPDTDFEDLDVSVEELEPEPEEPVLEEIQLEDSETEYDQEFDQDFDPDDAVEPEADGFFDEPDVEASDVEPEFEVSDLEASDVEVSDVEASDVEASELEEPELEEPELDEADLDEPDTDRPNLDRQETGRPDQSAPAFQLFEPVPAEQLSRPTPQVQVLAEPVPAVATSPPIALDESYPETNGIQAEQYYELPAAEVVDQLNQTALPSPEKRRRWPAFVSAILIGGTLGIGGAVALTTLQPTDQDEAASTPAPIVADEVGSGETTTVQNEDLAEQDQAVQPAVASPLLIDGELNVRSIEFVPGTAELTEKSQIKLDQVAKAVAGLPPEPTTITVRTFTEPTAQANRDLSTLQATAIGDYLESLGTEFGGISIRGIGAAPLQTPMPVENFVVVSSGLQTSGLKAAIAEIGPFDIGVDPDSLRLRPDSTEALSQIGRALGENPGSVTLAGYSYDRPNDAANKAMANAAVEIALDFLVTNHQVDLDRVSVLAPGALPYALGPDHGSHVDIKRGRSVAVDVAVHSLDQSVLSFPSGSDALSGAAAEELTRIASLLTEAEASAVVTVRSAGESSEEANNSLSERQAESIASFLADAGLAEGQVRVYGVGDNPRLRSDDATSEVMIKVLP